MPQRDATESRLGPRLQTGLLYGLVLGGASAAAINAPLWALIFVTLAGYIFFLWLWRLRFYPTLSYVDPGIFFQTVVLLYTVVPLLTLGAFGYDFVGVGDNRLVSIALDDEIIHSVWLASNLAMTGFGVSYLIFRKPTFIQLPTGVERLNAAMWPMLVLTLALYLGFVSIRGFGDYTDEYLFAASLPLALIQLLNIIVSLLWVIIFGILISNVRRKIGRAVGFAVLLAVMFYFISQARTNLAFIFMALLIANDHFRKRMPLGLLAAILAVGLVGIVVLGLARENSFFSDALARTEFMSVFITGLDVRQFYVLGSASETNLTLLLADVVRLVPQQILPFEKIDPATWYIQTFYPVQASAGSGYAFGMIAESMLGGGPSIALLRGLALGAVIGPAFNYLGRKRSLWAAIIYMWLFINLYQCFRDTTFTLGGRFLFQFGPAVLVLYLVTQMILSALRKEPAGPALTSPRPLPRS